MSSVCPLARPSRLDAFDPPPAPEVWNYATFPVDRCRYCAVYVLLIRSLTQFLHGRNHIPVPSGGLHPKNLPNVRETAVAERLLVEFAIDLAAAHHEGLCLGVIIQKWLDLLVRRLLMEERNVVFDAIFRRNVEGLLDHDVVEFGSRPDHH